MTLRTTLTAIFSSISILKYRSRRFTFHFDYIRPAFMMLISGMLFISCTNAQEHRHTQAADNRIEQISKTDSEWKAELSDEEYYVLREKGTERAFTGDLWDNKKTGKYYCSGCHLLLFSSGTKFKSGTGWPSFYQPERDDHIRIEKDTSFFMVREEVVCARCGGHLGHVFDDGPEPTGLRYCINSVSLDFEEAAPAGE